MDCLKDYFIKKRKCGTLLDTMICVKENAPVVLSLVMLSFIATLLDEFTDGKTTEMVFMTYHASLKNLMTYIRFFTHVLGHDGWSHFIGNATYLLLLGPMLEEKYGSRTMLEIVGITALITSIVNYIFFWNVGLCGASGIVFAFIILSSFTGFKEGEIPLSFILVTVIFVGQQVYEGIAFDDNISNITHIIGGLVGAVIGYVLNKKSRY